MDENKIGLTISFVTMKIGWKEKLLIWNKLNKTEREALKKAMDDNSIKDEEKLNPLRDMMKNQLYSKFLTKLEQLKEKIGKNGIKDYTIDTTEKTIYITLTGTEAQIIDWQKTLRKELGRFKPATIALKLIGLKTEWKVL